MDAARRRSDAKDLRRCRHRSASTRTLRCAIQRGVIYSIAPSYVDINRIWIGTDDGVIKTTTDGGATWKDVTPPALKPWMKVFNMDAGRFDARTAYAAVNTLRLDDMRPNLWRTHDGGATWTRSTPASTMAGRRARFARIRSGRACCMPRRNVALRLVRRRGSLAVAAAQHGTVVGARHHREG